MRIRLLRISFLLIILTDIQHVAAQQFSAISYNIRNDYNPTEPNNWNSRRSEVVRLLQYYKPDFFGVQEALLHQNQYIDSALTNYTYIGVGRDTGGKQGEYCALFVDTTRFSIKRSHTIWLSETPEKPSKSWDAAFPRIVSYALLQHNTSKQHIWVLNTHFDHVGVQARLQSAHIIRQLIDTLNTAKYPVLLMGDFNAEPTDEPIKYLSEHLHEASSISTSAAYGPVGTFNGFSSDVPAECIDYFFVQALSVTGTRHIDDRGQNQQLLSDHLPIQIFASF